MRLYNLKNLLLVCAIVAISISSCFAESGKWLGKEEILSAIQLPDIPEKNFNIIDYGAKAIEGYDNLPAIKAAIESAVESGGGKVIIPEGVWYVKGPVHLKSKINLHLAKGSRVLFSEHPSDYLPMVLTRWEGTELYSYSPLVYAANVQDVAITGEGTLDGNESSHFREWQTLQHDDMQRLRNMGANGIPREERIFTEGSHLRPVFVQFFHAKRVLLEDYTIVNAPFWINHLVYTESATVKGLKVDSHFANNDGLDIESSQLVLVENNWFRTGDDSVVVKSGRDLDGRTIGIPSKDIVVRNNDMGGEDGIALGSEMSGGISNVHFTDNVLRKGVSAIRFKANLDRGGLVEHIRVSNFKVESFETLFWFQLNYPGELGGNFPSTYRDIVFENFEVEEAGIFLEVHAPAAAPLEGVKFIGIQVEKNTTPFLLENARKLEFFDVRIGSQKVNGKLDWSE